MSTMLEQERILNIIKEEYLKQNKNINQYVYKRFIDTIPYVGITHVIGMLTGVDILKHNEVLISEEVVREIFIMESKGIKIPVRLSMYDPQGEVYSEETESFATLGNAMLWIMTLERRMESLKGKITSRTFTSSSIEMPHDCSCEIEILIPEEVEEMFCPKAARDASDYLLAQLQLLDINPYEFEDEFKLIKEAGKDVEVNVYGPNNAWSIENTALNEVIIDQESLNCYKEETGIWNQI